MVNIGYVEQILKFCKFRSGIAEILPVHISYLLCAFVHIEECTQALLMDFHHWLFFMSMVDF